MVKVEESLLVERPHPSATWTEHGGQYTLLLYYSTTLLLYYSTTLLKRRTRIEHARRYDALALGMLDAAPSQGGAPH